jgi:hypothetical protein
VGGEEGRERGSVVGGRREMKRARGLWWLVVDGGVISWRQRHCEDLDMQLMIKIKNLQINQS